MTTVVDSEPVLRRNFWINLSEGALYICSTSFVSAQTLLPALLVRLGGTNVEIGILGVMFYLGIYLPQVFTARHYESLAWKKPFTIRFGFTQRVMIFILGVIVVVFGGGAPRAALWLFLIFYSLNQLLAGVSTPVWFDLFTKLTPKEKRGRLAGARTALGGAGAFLAGLSLTWLLTDFRFPTGYAIALFVAFALQMASLIVQSRLTETQPSSTVKRKSVREFASALPQILRQDHGFRMFLFASAFLISAAMPIGFFTAYGLRTFRAGEESVGTFTLLMVGSQVIGALLIGYVADRFGQKAGLIGAGTGLFVANIIALAAPTLGWFSLLYPFLGIFLGTEVMARYNLSAEFAPPAQRSTYVGLMNTVLSPLYLLAIVAGLLGDSVGFPLVFLLGALLSATGIALLAKFVADPRWVPASR